MPEVRLRLTVPSIHRHGRFSPVQIPLLQGFSKVHLVLCGFPFGMCWYGDGVLICVRRFGGSGRVQSGQTR
ncbi:hypothetical protein BDA96_03G235600 [Sorghum bicolor]|uniref:Uncharacterized protein n=2 Tax=Sorghum bicolor TaxID=4558 RepID=A0A921RFK1_SORBI|nr:hypothetical protein BDA96_08G151700 [Sorghum bicolor]KAG0538431.1 hypothetical protein BDA96_03G235600 [Sorghum bicolor]KXG23766.1 hypothetical protein SORBI_3008G137400 [Sorghum bicolor]